MSQLWSRLKYMQTIWLYLLRFCSWKFNFFFFYLFSLHNGNLQFRVLHPWNPWTIRYQDLPWGIHNSIGVKPYHLPAPLSTTPSSVEHSTLRERWTTESRVQSRNQKNLLATEERGLSSNVSRSPKWSPHFLVASDVAWVSGLCWKMLTTLYIK